MLQLGDEVTPELSICIPTFNRRQYLSDLFESLAPQLDPEVEVVVSDNASTDGTADMIREWQTRLPRLSYKRWEKNHGADHNYLSVVEMASGRYCWLMGSDDIADPHAVRTIRAALHRGPDCLLFARELRTADMTPLTYQSFWAFPGERWFDFSKEPFASYLESSTSICALFSYLSSIVFRREMWMRDTMKQRLVGSAYAHADILIRQLASGGSLLVSDKAVVRCRCGNDSFSDGNKGRRLSLDFDGYAKIAEQTALSGHRKGIMQILIREHPWRNLIHVLRHKRSLGRQPEREFIDLLTLLGVSRPTLGCYRFLSRSPWFEIFLAIEPFFKKNSPLVRLKRRLRRMCAVSKAGT